MLIIEPIKAFDDNYIWLMTKNNKSVVVDPGDATEIIKLIDNKTIKLEGVLITHHHYDHTNGLAELIEKKNLKVFGPKNNWKNASKKDVKNKDLCIELDKYVAKHNVKWHWVKGHAGHEKNEIADTLANKGIDSL